MFKKNRNGKVLAIGIVAAMLIISIGVYSMFSLADVHFHDTYFEITWPR